MPVREPDMKQRRGIRCGSCRRHTRLIVLVLMVVFMVYHLPLPTMSFSFVEKPGTYEEYVDMRIRNGMTEYASWKDMRAAKGSITFDSWRTGLWKIKVLIFHC